MLNSEEQKLLKTNNSILRIQLRIEKNKFIAMLEETDLQTIKSIIRVEGYLMTISDLFFADKKGCYTLSREEKEYLRICRDLLESRLKELKNETEINKTSTIEN